MMGPSVPPSNNTDGWLADMLKILSDPDGSRQRLAEITSREKAVQERRLELDALDASLRSRAEALAVAEARCKQMLAKESDVDRREHEVSARERDVSAREAKNLTQKGVASRWIG